MKTLELGQSPRVRKPPRNIRTTLEICQSLGIKQSSFCWLIWTANRAGKNLNPVKGGTYSYRAVWDVNELLRCYPEQFAQLRPRNAWTTLMLETTEDQTEEDA